jgi:ATP synthase protein I
VTVVIAAGVLGFTGAWAAFSALTGGLISVLANLYFAWRLLKVEGTTSPVHILSVFYLGEGIKISMTVALFLFAIVVLRVEALYTVFTYIATLPAYWLALLIRSPNY